MSNGWSTDSQGTPIITGDRNGSSGHGDRVKIGDGSGGTTSGTMVGGVAVPDKNK